MATAVARSRRAVDESVSACATLATCRAVPSFAQRLQSSQRDRTVRDLRSAVARVHTVCKAMAADLRANPPRAPSDVSAVARHVLVVRAQLQFDRLLLWLQLNEPEPPASIPGTVAQTQCHACTCHKCR
jgi:hypothetical protein